MSDEKTSVNGPTAKPQVNPVAKIEDKPSKAEKDQPVFRDWAAI